MASGKGTKGSQMKSPKQEEEDDDFLEDLVVDSDPKKPKKPAMYSNLKPGGFVTRAEDRKGRLEKRQAKIETAKDDDDDDDNDDDNEDDNEEETEKEQLEWETRELQSKLQKTEKSSRKSERQRRMR